MWEDGGGGRGARGAGRRRGGGVDPGRPMGRPPSREGFGPLRLLRPAAVGRRPAALLLHEGPLDDWPLGGHRRGGSVHLHAGRVRRPR
eukprot:6779616-Prymnesium_polylepis.1